MADIIYNINQDDPNNIQGFEQFSQADTQLVTSFEINTLFNREKNYVELHILNLADDLLESDYNYTSYKELGNAQSAGKEGASILTIDPVQDIEQYGYDSGDVKLLYHFLNDLYSQDNRAVEFFIQDISPDRTELKLQTFNLTNEEILNLTNQIKERLSTQSYFSEFRLNFKNNDLFIGINIDTLLESENRVITVKLYEPLPLQYDLKNTLSIVETVCDSAAYVVDSLLDTTEEPLPYLRPANFNLDVIDNETIPTSYLSYDELFSFPINNTNSQVYSLVQEKGVELSIDHTDYRNFVHFSSAYERLANFKYKLQLIESYSSSLAQIGNATSQSLGITGSTSYYENLTQGIISNFDHYERFLYYESSSFAWPKSNTTKPYINIPTSNNTAINWYANQLTVANNYDLTNVNAVVNSIPSFLREDPNNTNYITFIHMIGQHFDNLWIYTKGVSDKYNADNRLDFGVSKDLVAEVLKNFGVKLYTSNKSIEDLFSSFIGQAYQSGSEVINTYVTGSVTGSNTPIQPSSLDNYQREVYKRIYHNLPLLLKSKGTERGLRALINCFGIPSDILDIKVYGGRNTNERPFYGDYRYYTSSLNKVRLDNTGSIVTGSTLSNYTSIVKRDNKYTDDLHPIEIGFSPTDNVDNYIINKQSCGRYTVFNPSPTLGYFSYIDCNGIPVLNVGLAGTFITINAIEGSIDVGTNSHFVITTVTAPISINIDDYLGDPRNLYLDDYYNIGPSNSITGSLSLLTDQIMSGSDAYNVQDFVRLIKFFDNTIFKTVKDFIPARSVADTGIIIKPHLLQRNKAKSVQVEVEQPVYTGSIDTAFIAGNDGNSFGGQNNYITSYVEQVQTPLGISFKRSHFQEQAKYDGEFLGTELEVSSGELNLANPFKYENPIPSNLYVTLIQDFPSNICKISPTYSPITLTSHSSRNVALDFTSLGISGITFISASTNITSQISAFTFPSTNYQQHVISASQDISGCSGSITYTTAYCDLAPAGVAPFSILSGSATMYDLTTWFNAGSNTNTSFTASWNGNVTGITTPLSYVFTQPTGSVIITQKDNILTNCSQSISINIIAAPYECTYLDYIVVRGNEFLDPGGGFQFYVSGSYIPCNNGAGGTPQQFDLGVFLEDYIHEVNECIISGSLQFHPGSWNRRAYYDLDQQCIF